VRWIEQTPDSSPEVQQLPKGPSFFWLSSSCLFLVVWVTAAQFAEVLRKVKAIIVP
jgi:hypothetical protein